MKHAVILGAGAAGLSAAVELDKNSVSTTILEIDGGVGGLARTLGHDGHTLSRAWYDGQSFDYPLDPMRLARRFGAISAS